ncbi:ABC transporter ATP-binding protein [Zobellia laminariae]|uniref:ABC transporter ATP-binding protein n=1 Tax=Zobellia laminariae TaxID=248906 RepID=UPI0026F45058|nr:ABC transporter ATP-binding protein [Zobellia laminariae]WKX75961.1 ABC transporter ATP-binding protein [Zobellia laminariae]
MSKKIIKIEDLKREFTMGTETVHALRGISFDIKEGEFVTIMGSSGSGKSTLLNILGCLDQPTAGNYEIDGVKVKNLSRNELATIRNEKIGFIFQSYNLLARTSAIENVELPLLYNSSVSTEERRERAIKALEMVGLGERLHHTPSQLSGGQQQRVAIARSLVNNPVMILADEATGNLDTRTSYEIMSLLQELNKKGITITFVTHEPDIATFSNRTIVLKDGDIMQDYKNHDIQSAAEELAKLPKQDD